VALLPRIAAQRLTGFAQLKVLACDAPLKALPIYASYRSDPTSSTVDTLLKSAVEFAGSAMPPKRRTKKGATKP